MHFGFLIKRLQEISTIEAIRVRAFASLAPPVHDSSPDMPPQLRAVMVELTSELDLFLHWRCTLDAPAFTKLQVRVDRE